MLPLLTLASVKNLLAAGSGHADGSAAGGWASVSWLSVSINTRSQASFCEGKWDVLHTDLWLSAWSLHASIAVGYCVLFKVKSNTEWRHWVKRRLIVPVGMCLRHHHSVCGITSQQNKQKSTIWNSDERHERQLRHTFLPRFWALMGRGTEGYLTVVPA